MKTLNLLVCLHVALTSPAWAGVVGPSLGAAVDGASPAATLEVNPSGVGHVNLVPYYSVRSGFDTYVNIVNTDTRNGKAVKVRFRAGGVGEDVGNFTVLLGPGDKWAAALTRDAAKGYPRVVHNDRTCTLPADVRVLLGPMFVTMPNAELREVAESAQAGSVEIIAMADIPRLTSTGQLSPLFAAVTTATGASGPTCGSAALDALALDSVNYSEARSKGLEVPTTGLMTQWTLINVPRAVSYTGRAVAVEARVAAGGLPGYGNLVLFPQTDLLVDDASRTAELYTTAPLRKSTRVYIESGFPDLSTPYLPSGLAAMERGVAARQQAYAISAALAVGSIESEFVTEPAILAKTDWVVNLPTRYLEVGFLWSALPAISSYVWTDLTKDHSGAPVGGVVQNHFVAGVNVGDPDTSYPVCVLGIYPYNSNAAATHPQTETAFRTHEGVSANLQPPAGDTAPFKLCGQSSLLRFTKPADSSDDGALGIGIRRQLVATYSAGWGRIQITGVAGRGLPIIGFAASELYNAAVAPGVAGIFGQTFPLGTTKPVAP